MDVHSARVWRACQKLLTLDAEMTPGCSPERHLENFLLGLFLFPVLFGGSNLEDQGMSILGCYLDTLKDQACKISTKKELLLAFFH